MTLTYDTTLDVRTMHVINVPFALAKNDFIADIIYTKLERHDPLPY